MNNLERKLQQIRNCRPQCCCTFIGPTGPTGPTGPFGGPTGPTERLFKSSNRIIIDSS